MQPRQVYAMGKWKTVQEGTAPITDCHNNIKRKGKVEKGESMDEQTMW